MKGPLVIERHIREEANQVVQDECDQPAINRSIRWRPPSEIRIPAGTPVLLVVALTRPLVSVK